MYLACVCRVYGGIVWCRFRHRSTPAASGMIVIAAMLDTHNTSTTCFHRTTLGTGPPSSTTATHTCRIEVSLKTMYAFRSSFAPRSRSSSDARTLEVDDGALATSWLAKPASPVRPTEPGLVGSASTCSRGGRRPPWRPLWRPHGKGAAHRFLRGPSRSQMVGPTPCATSGQ